MAFVIFLSIFLKPFCAKVLSGALALDDRNGSSGSQLQQQTAGLEMLSSQHQQQQIVSITTVDPQIVIAPDDKSIISG